MKVTHGRGYVYSIQYHMVWYIKYRYLLVAGLFVGFWNAVKNTITVFKEVYGKK